MPMTGWLFCLLEADTFLKHDDAMRDRRFIAVHRGGLLIREDHAALARWAVDCAEAVLPWFERESDDPHPRQAVEIVRLWADGQVKTGVAMKAALAAHAAARRLKHPVAVAVARAAGHAVATAHAADHSLGALLYALKAHQHAGLSGNDFFEAQMARLPSHLYGMVTDGMIWRLKAMKIAVGELVWLSQVESP